MRTQSVATVTDPICGMRVTTNRGLPSAEYGGKVYHFCAECCKAAFLANPAKHHKAAIRPKGWWSRYLDRVCKANQEVFGAAGPRCH